MKSELSAECFYKRLSERVTPEKTLWLFTNYNFSREPFCGTYTHNSFELTKNSHMQHIKAIVIKGKYQNTAGDKTEVLFTVKNQHKWLIRTFFILFVIVIHVFQFLKMGFEVSTFLKMDVVLALLYLFGLTIRRFSEFIVKQKFKDEFMIDIKPTDLHGYGGSDEN